MKVTLPLENNSLFDKYLNAEHGYSAWIEDEDIKVLYDCGYSDKFIKNAGDLKIDLRTADYVVISHGHYDHSWGFKYLIKYYREMAMARKPILLFAHRDILLKKYAFDLDKPVGMDVDLEVMEKFFDVRFVSEPLWLTKNLCYMGITEISNNFEREFPQAPKKLKEGKWIEDFVIEDTQFAYKHKSSDEVSVVAACAHYGICNIMEYAKKITGRNKINTYLGGSHLRIEEISKNQLEKTCEYVRKTGIKNFYICHDTDIACKFALANSNPILEAGVGLTVECD